MQSEHEEAGRHLVAVIREVLAAHERQRNRLDPLVTKCFQRRLIEDVHGFGRVLGHGIADAVVEVRRAAVRRRHGGCRGLHAIHGHLLRLGLQCANRAFELDFVGDDVVRGGRRGTSWSRSRRIERIGVARDDGLEGLHDGAAGDDGVMTKMREGGVGAGTAYGELPHVGGGEQRAGTCPDDAEGIPRPAVQAVHLFDRRTDALAGQAPILHHPLTAGAAFFRRVERRM